MGTVHSDLVKALESEDFRTARKLLLEERLDVNGMLDKRGVPLLANACLNGKLGAVKVLVEVGSANANLASGTQGTTALHHAVASGQDEIVEYLVKKGANPDIADAHGNTSVHIAAMGDRDSIIRCIAPAAAINAVNEQGNSPLHLAARNGAKSACEALTECGADLSLVNSDGETALNLAESCAKPDVSLFLTDAMSRMSIRPTATAGAGGLSSMTNPLGARSSTSPSATRAAGSDSPKMGRSDRRVSVGGTLQTDNPAHALLRAMQAKKGAGAGAGK